jgi:hypothetical protein
MTTYKDKNIGHKLEKLIELTVNRMLNKKDFSGLKIKVLKTDMTKLILEVSCEVDINVYKQRDNDWLFYTFVEKSLPKGIKGITGFEFDIVLLNLTKTNTNIT